MPRARALDEDTLARRRRVLGDDHPDTLTSANNLAADLRALGEHAAARELDEDTLARLPPGAGRGPPRHPAPRPTTSPATWPSWASTSGPRPGRRHPRPAAAGCWATTTPTPWTRPTTSPATWRELGEYAAARALDEDILARRRRVLGDDHPDTLDSAVNLSHDLTALGADVEARDLDREIFERRQRLLGEDHPGTLIAAWQPALRLHPARPGCG